jgi:nucleoside-diphosphate-sugar epimerase
MKVLLLGATGRVGSRLIPALLAHQHQVVAYVRSASKVPTSVASQLSAVVEGPGTDSESIKATILKENCDAVINAAGLAAMTSWHKPSQLPEIFAAVVKAAVEAGKERGGPPLRCWLMSGFGTLDSPNKPYLLLD